MKKEKSAMGKVVVCAFVLLMLGAFSSQVLAASETIIDVPFKAQVPPGNWSETKNCGQASALMTFCYYNPNLTNPKRVSLAPALFSI